MFKGLNFATTLVSVTNLKEAQEEITEEGGTIIAKVKVGLGQVGVFIVFYKNNGSVN